MCFRASYFLSSFPNVEDTHSMFEDPQRVMCLEKICCFGRHVMNQATANPAIGGGNCLRKVRAVQYFCANGSVYPPPENVPSRGCYLETDYLQEGAEYAGCENPERRDWKRPFTVPPLNSKCADYQSRYCGCADKNATASGDRTYCM